MIFVDPGARWASWSALLLGWRKPARAAVLRRPVRHCGGQRAGQLFMLRPALAADAAAQRALCVALAPRDLRLFGGGAPSADDLAREAGSGSLAGVSLVALRAGDASGELVGLARLAADPDGLAGEFAILVHPAAQRRGLGRLLMERLLAECRLRGLRLVRAAALPRNRAMLALARACGFQLLPAADGTVELVLALAPDKAGGAGGVVR